MRTMEKEEQEQVERASIMINQMGGLGKLKAMVNARNFRLTNNGMIFTFSGSKEFNTCKVELNGLDYYDMSFSRITAKKIELDKEKIKDVDCDNLITVFEDITKLALSLKSF